MASLTYQAARTSGNPRNWTVTRSTDDALGDARAAFVFDTVTVLDKLSLGELVKDTLHAVSKDFGAVSSPAHLTDAGGAFDDGALFADDAIFSDQVTTWQATLANNAAVVVRSSDEVGTIGAADAALILAAGHNKIELWSAVRAIQRALQRDALAASKPSSYPISGSIVV
jgi:hypothetical protein